MRINLFNQNPSVRIPSARLRKALQKISAGSGIKSKTLNYLFVSDRVIRKYNKKYLRHDRPTDVIAFEGSPPHPSVPSPRFRREGKMLFGDIMISSDTAKRQAREQGHPFRREVLILAVHGLLHLLGYRDKKKSDRDRMWRKTDAWVRLVNGLC